jgi:hypothetical protein
MPLLYKVVSATSEDEVHPAENIGNDQLFRTWQTDGPAQKAAVEIEFDTPVTIKNLEIGRLLHLED